MNHETYWNLMHLPTSGFVTTVHKNELWIMWIIHSGIVMISEILQWSVLQVFAAFPSTNLQLTCLAACQGDTCQFPVYDTRFNQSVNFIHVSYVVKYTVNDRHLQACCFVSSLALLTLIYCLFAWSEAALVKKLFYHQPLDWSGKFKF